MTESTETLTEKGGKKLNNKHRGGIVLLTILIAGSIIGARQWVYSKTHVETDDAFVETHVHAVSSKVPAQVKEVLAKDNQLVRKGELLVLLDESDYLARMRTAAASLAVAKNEIAGGHAQVAAAKAGVSVAAAQLEQAQLDLGRAEQLYAKEVIAKEQLEKVATAEKVARLRLREAQEAERQAKAQLGTAGKDREEARIMQRRGELDAAALNLSYTRVVAPVDGYVTRKSVEKGNFVQAGQAMMAIVPLDGAWITANYKESQLAAVHPGQAVKFTVDGCPGRAFTGCVDSIMAGTGAAFSLLPPENATGNYVKVVQRIPVKISIDRQSDPAHLLRAGMSVVPTIITGGDSTGKASSCSSQMPASSTLSP